MRTTRLPYACLSPAMDTFTFGFPTLVDSFYLRTDVRSCSGSWTQILLTFCLLLVCHAALRLVRVAVLFVGFPWIRWTLCRCAHRARCGMRRLPVPLFPLVILLLQRYSGSHASVPPHSWLTTCSFQLSGHCLVQVFTLCISSSPSSAILLSYIFCKNIVLSPAALALTNRRSSPAGKSWFASV